MTGEKFCSDAPKVGQERRFGGPLVEETFAASGATETGDAIVAVPLAFEFVVIRELLICLKLEIAIFQYGAEGC